MTDAAVAESPGLGHSQPPPEAAAPTDTAAQPQERAYDPLMLEVGEEMGWTTKDKWKGNPEEWRDLDEFFRHTPKVIKSLKDQIKRSSRVASEQIEKARQDAIADAERRIAAAAAAGDPDAAAKATEDLKRANAKPDPQVEEFAARNSWFNSDQAMTQVAIAAAGKVANNGGSVAEQLAAAEKEVRKRFPEEFGDEAPKGESRPTPPAVHGGQRAASPGASRKKGWADIPATTRASITPKYLKTFNITQEDYAVQYWREQEGG